MLDWYEPVLYLDPVSKFPEATERSGHFVGFADNVGDSIALKILKNDLITVLHRSAVRSAPDANHLNKRVTFKIDVQLKLDQLDNDTGNTNKNRYSKNKARDINTDVSTRTRSKIAYPDQNVGATTRSKMQVTCSLSAQGLLYTLHYVIYLSNSNTYTRDDLQLGINQYKMYHDGLIKIKDKHGRIRD
jgi:hypothetical protein